MAEVTGIVNSRPLTAFSHDPENPMIISPNTILTMKTGLITKVLPSEQDSSVRSVEIRVIRNNVASFITSPVSEIVLTE